MQLQRFSRMARISSPLSVALLLSCAAFLLLLLPSAKAIFIDLDSQWRFIEDLPKGSVLHGIPRASLHRIAASTLADDEA
jgi:hypothetical protein